MLGVIFEDFYICVSLTYEDKLQDNYSILNEFLMNYTQIISLQKTVRGSVLKGLMQPEYTRVFMCLYFYKLTRENTLLKTMALKCGEI